MPPVSWRRLLTKPTFSVQEHVDRSFLLMLSLGHQNLGQRFQTLETRIRGIALFQKRFWNSIRLWREDSCNGCSRDAYSRMRSAVTGVHIPTGNTRNSQCRDVTKVSLQFWHCEMLSNLSRILYGCYTSKTFYKILLWKGHILPCTYIALFLLNCNINSTIVHPLPLCQFKRYYSRVTGNHLMA